MTIRAFSAVAGFLGLCVSVVAQQQTDFPDVFSGLNYAFLRLPSLALSDEQLFAFPMAFSFIETTTLSDSLPALPGGRQLTTGLLTTVEKPQRTAIAAASPKDSSKEVVEVQPSNSGYSGGEVGALYGKSTGKFGGDVEAGYITGEVGNDKIHISAGASYERSSGRVPRFGR